MNLLSQLNATLNTVQRAYAHVTSVKPDGTLIAQTPAGATVLLQGKAEVGKSVYYDRVSGKILGDAPDVVFSEYGV